MERPEQMKEPSQPLPPPKADEYEIAVPTKIGLNFKKGPNGEIVFDRADEGTYLDIVPTFRNVGDVVVAIGGLDLSGMTFQEAQQVDRSVWNANPSVVFYRMRDVKLTSSDVSTNTSPPPAAAPETVLTKESFLVLKLKEHDRKLGCLNKQMLDCEKAKVAEQNMMAERDKQIQGLKGKLEELKKHKAESLGEESQVFDDQEGDGHSGVSTA